MRIEMAIVLRHVGASEAPVLGYPLIGDKPYVRMAPQPKQQRGSKLE